MNTNFAIVGGDLRTIKLAKMLSKEKEIIYTYGLEKAEELKNTKNIIECNKLEMAVQNAEIIIGPTPFSSNGEEINTPFGQEKVEILEFFQKIQNKILIAGSIQQQNYELAKQNQVEIIDLMQREELAVLNAISTAEGAIEIAMNNTEKIIQGREILILGFGRIGKILAKKLQGLSAKVTCAVRKKVDFAWIEAYGYKAISINDLGRNLSQYDIIINTVPKLILNQERIQYIKKESLLIDLASKPGGIDINEAKKMKIKAIWALALPGKVAPVTTAEYMKKTIYNIIEEIKNIKI